MCLVWFGRSLDDRRTRLGSTMPLLRQISRAVSPICNRFGVTRRAHEKCVLLILDDAFIWRGTYTIFKGSESEGRHRDKLRSRVCCTDRLETVPTVLTCGWGMGFGGGSMLDLWLRERRLPTKRSYTTEGGDLYL